MNLINNSQTVLLQFCNMNCNPQKLFVIVGNPHSGKTKTIQAIFNRTNFFPLKQPIDVPWEQAKKFVVINCSDFNFRSKSQLERLKSVLNHHIGDAVSFVMPLSICFDGSSKDITEVLEYIKYLDIETHHLVLYSSWFDKKVIEEETLEKYTTLQNNGTIHLFDRLITKSPPRFEERTNDMILLMKELVNSRR